MVHACFRAVGKLLVHPGLEENWKPADRFTRGLHSLALPGPEGTGLWQVGVHSWAGPVPVQPPPAPRVSPLQQLIQPRPGSAPRETH